MPSNSGQLWIIATPLGNPGDLSPRAKEFIQSADLLLAEDSRRAGFLFHACKIPQRPVLSYFEHNEAERLDEILAALKAGRNIALISDAGTPLLADPGYRLVRACRKQGIRVSPVPGPSAPAAALSAAGLPPIPYSFLGFLPRDKGSLRALFQSFATIPGSLIFFERKDRLAASLALAYEILGERETAICRELTKTHEEFRLGLLSEYPRLSENLLGEITVILGPASETERQPQADICTELQKALALGQTASQAVKSVSARAKGWSKKQVYELLLKLKKQENCPNLDLTDGEGSPEKTDSA